MGQPLCCSAADAGVWGDRGYGDGSTHYAWLSSMALLPWLPGFPLQAFPTTVSSLTSSRSVPLQSTAAQPWDYSTIPNFSIQPLGLPGDLIPFRLPQISCFTLSLKRFSSDSDSCPSMGIGPLLQFPHPPETGPVPLTLLFFPPSSFVLLSSACFYILFPSGQVLLLDLSMHFRVWRCIPDVSMEREVLHIHLFLLHLVLTRIFLKYGFLQIHVQQRDCRIIW